MDLNEPFEGHQHATTSMKVVLLIFAVVLIGALGYLIKATYGQEDTTDYSAPSVKSKTAETASGTTDETSATTTYTNSAHSYSFSYENSYKLTATQGDAETNASTSSESVSVKKSGESDAVFSVTTTSLTTLNENSIKGDFGATKAENITVTSTTVGGKPGYKVTIANDSSVVSDFYFVATPSAKILRLTVAKNSSVAAKALSSFTFTK